MNQTELANRLGVSKAYISMIISGKKKPSKKVATRLRRIGIEVNSEVNFEANNPILNHARLPIPTLPLMLFPTPFYIFSRPPPFKVGLKPFSPTPLKRN